MSEPPGSDDPNAYAPEDPRRLPDDGLGQSPELETIDLDGDESQKPPEQDEDSR